MTHISLYHVREDETQSISAAGSSLTDELGVDITDESDVAIDAEETTNVLLLHAKGDRNFYSVEQGETIAITSALLLEDGTAILNEDGTELLAENHVANMRSVLYHG